MPSASNRIRRSKPTRPLGDQSALTIRLRGGDLQVVELGALARLAAALGVDAARRDVETDGEYRHRLRRGVERREAEMARGVA